MANIVLGSTTVISESGGTVSFESTLSKEICQEN